MADDKSGKLIARAARRGRPQGARAPDRGRRRGGDPHGGAARARARRRRRGDRDRRHGRVAARRHARHARAAVREAPGGLRRAVPHRSRTRRSAPRRSCRVRPRARSAARSCTSCPARRARCAWAWRSSILPELAHIVGQLRRADAPPTGVASGAENGPVGARARWHVGIVLLVLAAAVLLPSEVAIWVDRDGPHLADGSRHAGARTPNASRPRTSRSAGTAAAPGSRCRAARAPATRTTATCRRCSPRAPTSSAAICSRGCARCAACSAISRRDPRRRSCSRRSSATAAGSSRRATRSTACSRPRAACPSAGATRRCASAPRSTRSSRSRRRATARSGRPTRSSRSTSWSPTITSSRGARTASRSSRCSSRRAPRCRSSSAARSRIRSRCRLYTRAHYLEAYQHRFGFATVGFYDGAIHVVSAKRPRNELYALVAHEYVHALFKDATGSHQPFYLNEGIADRAEEAARGRPQLSREEWRRLVEALRADEWIPLDSLVQGFSGLKGAQALLAYLESRAAIELIETRRPGAIAAFLAACAGGADLAGRAASGHGLGHARARARAAGRGALALRGRSARLAAAPPTRIAARRCGHGSRARGRAALAAFTATHMGLSSLRVRPRLVAALGEMGFLGLYSVIALAIFVPLIWLYFTSKHAGALLWYLPRGPLFTRGRLRGHGASRSCCWCRASCARARAASSPGDATPRGVYRITRHPMVMAFVVFALVHLLPNGSTRRRRLLRRLRGLRAGRRRAPGPAQARPARPATATSTSTRRSCPSPAATRCRACASSRRSRSLGGVLLTVAIRYFHSGWFGGNP